MVDSRFVSPSTSEINQLHIYSLDSEYDRYLTIKFRGTYINIVIYICYTYIYIY